jgi:hypothetical protein
MDAETRNAVRRRANNRCEYCARRQDESPLTPLQIEHIIPRKHHGSDDLENLALACTNCNLYKGSNIAGYDPQAGDLTPLFHPRRDDWSQHFEWRGALILGKTAIGRTTVDVLRLNSSSRIRLRIASREEESEP